MKEKELKNNIIKILSDYNSIRIIELNGGYSICKITFNEMDFKPFKIKGKINLVNPK